MPARLEVPEVRASVAKAGFGVQELGLVTTLLDPNEFSRADLVNLDRQRWTIELDLRWIEVEMGLEVRRCKTRELVEKEIRTHLLAYNLVRTAMAEAARVGRTTPGNLSFRGAWPRLLAFQDKGGGRSGRRRKPWATTQQQAMTRYRRGLRPGRNEPRAVKRRPKSQSDLVVPRYEARKSPPATKSRLRKCRLVLAVVQVAMRGILPCLGGRDAALSDLAMGENLAGLVAGPAAG